MVDKIKKKKERTSHNSENEVMTGSIINVKVTNKKNMENIFDEGNFGDEAELKAQTVEWGVVGDTITGTFIKARHAVETQYGPNSIYEILAEKGQFHKLEKKVPVKEATVINKGETWSVWGRNEIFNGILNSLRPGQVVKLTFSEEMDTKMGQAKIVKIHAPRDNEGKPMMNEEYLESLGLAGV